VVATVVEEFEQDGVVYEKDGVKVIAFTVDHGPATSSPPSAIARIRGPPGGDPGDTRYNQNVIKFGTGADVLIHEVCIARPELLGNVIIQRTHESPHQSSRSRAGVLSGQAETRRIYTLRLSRD
jgi:ribonuclease Z